MTRLSLASAKARCDVLSDGGKIYDSAIPNNNYNYKLLNSGFDNHKANSGYSNPHSLTGDYNYNPRPSGKKNYGRVLKADPVCRMAITAKDKGGWGMFPGAVVNRCKALGYAKVKEAIHFVANIENAYFDDPDRPVPDQRGGYAMEILNNGGLEK